MIVTVVTHFVTHTYVVTASVFLHVRALIDVDQCRGIEQIGTEIDTMTIIAVDDINFHGLVEIVLE